LVERWAQFALSKTRRVKAQHRVARKGNKKQMSDRMLLLACQNLIQEWKKWDALDECTPSNGMLDAISDIEEIVSSTDKILKCVKCGIGIVQLCDNCRKGVSITEAIATYKCNVCGHSELSLK
jgi:hypothetical protein